MSLTTREPGTDAPRRSRLSGCGFSFAEEAPAMIFISTCSQDSTTDMVTGCLDKSNVFRFNIDKPEDYSWDFNPEGFQMANKATGMEVSDKTLTSFYLRKPMYYDLIDIPKFGCLENWKREEMDELFSDFYRECQSRGLTALVISQNNKYGKLRQMLAAKQYFKVAPWHLFHGALPRKLEEGRWVVKSLTATSLGYGKAFFVKEITPRKLDLAYPWFVQERIDGEEEVTVVYVDGKMYAASAKRESFDGDDSRKALFSNPVSWPKCALSAEEENAIRAFMTETGYKFGRFDFIRKNGELWFLELNPNGQWAWLDLKKENGLVKMVADAITREDRVHREKLSAGR